jgi:hypothetical protein
LQSNNKKSNPLATSLNPNLKSFRGRRCIDCINQCCQEEWMREGRNKSKDEDQDVGIDDGDKEDEEALAVGRDPVVGCG